MVDSGITDPEAGSRGAVGCSGSSRLRYPRVPPQADSEGIVWPPPPQDYQPGQDAVQVWAASLDVSPTALSEFASTLAPAELERAARFRLEQHRNRFIAGRGILRAVLGGCLEAEPGSIEFGYGQNGKPFVQGNSAAPGTLQFNLAHSENLALIAVGRNRRLGVDVEFVRLLPNAEQLVDRFFSPGESLAFRALALDQKALAFFNLWARKEAWLKATGEGITRSLNRVEVSFLPGETPQLLNIGGNVDEAKKWNLRELSPAPGFVGALAFEAGDTLVNCWRWPGAMPDALAHSRS